MMKRRSARTAFRAAFQSCDPDKCDPENNRTIIEQPKARWCGAPSRLLQLNVQYKTREINGLCIRATESQQKSRQWRRLRSGAGARLESD
jgi:hypothetical protein